MIKYLSKIKINKTLLLTKILLQIISNPLLISKLEFPEINNSFNMKNKLKKLK
jgi:hypothetical protein